jgi:hypothetical protein
MPHMTRDKELWALALHVERKHGVDGPRYIAEQLGKCALAGDRGGIDFWHAVAVRFDKMREDRAC